MLVTIKNIPKEIKVTNVTLSYDIDDIKEDKLKMFFCYNCQNPVAQYQGEVLSIMPGATPVRLPIIVKCPHCKKLYRFNAII
jgi:RNase P subunit RPR2